MFELLIVAFGELGTLILDGIDLIIEAAVNLSNIFGKDDKK